LGTGMIRIIDATIKKDKKINKKTKYSGGAAVYHYGQVRAG